MLSGRGLCDELITRPEESYRLCCVVVCDLETSRICAPYIYDSRSLRVKNFTAREEEGRKCEIDSKDLVSWLCDFELLRKLNGISFN